MARNVKFEIRRGAGSSLEVLFGKVSLTPTMLHTVANSVVLPAPTTFDLVNGIAIATNVAPSPAPVGGQVPWAYKVKITDNFGKSWEYLVGVPDGTTEINFNVLPRYFETKPPLFGQGVQGVPGSSATIAIGTTTSGVTPAVTNTGTSTDAVLNFQLPKGDKGDTGVGVPAGGTALQVVRKNAANTTTEWATVDKATLGLSNVDNTSDATKPLSVPQKTYIDNMANSTDAGVAGLVSSNNSVTRNALNTYLQDELPMILPGLPDGTEGLITSQEKDLLKGSVAIGSTRLNNLTTVGSYHQNIISLVNAENDYPVGGTNTVVRVFPISTLLIGQEALSVIPNRVHTRYRSSQGSWSVWKEQGDEKVTKSYFSQEHRPYPLEATNKTRLNPLLSDPPTLVRSGNSMELHGRAKNVVASGSSPGFVTLGTLPPDAIPSGGGRWIIQHASAAKTYSLIISAGGAVQMYNLTDAAADSDVTFSAMWAVAPASVYQFDRVCARMFVGTDYSRTLTNNSSSFSVICIHGGEAEVGTSEIGGAIRDALSTSWYEWDIKKPTVQGVTAFNLAHEVNSTFGSYKNSLFDDTGMVDMVLEKDDCIAFHGAADGTPENGRPSGALTLLGGENVTLRQIMGRHLRDAGFPALDDPKDFPSLAGSGPTQPHNLAKNKGVQIEMSTTQRRDFFVGGDTSRLNRTNTTPAFLAYRDAILAAIAEYKA